MFVVILQVTFHFMTNKDFLANYGFDDLINELLGPIKNYIDFIGL